MERISIAAAIAYVCVLGWAMTAMSYDMWGALVAAPIIVVITVPLVRRIFAGEHAALFPFAVAGLLAKFGGSLIRYYVSYVSYSGWADSNDYSLHGSKLAGAVRSGSASPFTLIPGGLGTTFIDHLTGLVYTVFGASRLAGFFVFTWMGYWGAVFFLRAALVAVPGLSVKRYAGLIFLAPSMIYWPTAIGKEAWLFMSLGLASYGGAHILAGRASWWSFFLTSLGMGGTILARPHFAAIWVAGLVAALFVGLLTGSGGRGLQSRLFAGVLALVALIALVLIGSVTLKFLNPQSSEGGSVQVTDRISAIFKTATTQTSQGHSSFVPVAINGPQDWPEAVLRTLSRPLLNEARSLAELIPAVESTLLLLWAIFNIRRFANIPRMILKSSYVFFALAVLFMFGLAFARISNLGILTRERSLVLPLLLLMWCLPPLPRREVERPPLWTAAEAAEAAVAVDAST
ncbi:unannotated protein [freshwater metagenome]|uniref:Unannotated protein n=1 Tax=freshwater metagenome TaxID=449393 RepID=A0A6J7FKD3_9ZZZZ|nr:hypothetical protein [Actinomycetota bacterium]